MAEHVTNTARTSSNNNKYNVTTTNISISTTITNNPPTHGRVVARCSARMRSMISRTRATRTRAFDKHGMHQQHQQQ